MAYIDNIDAMNLDELETKHEECLGQRASMLQKIYYLEKMLDENKTKYNGYQEEQQFGREKIVSCMIWVAIFLFIEIMLLIILPALGANGIFYSFLLVIVLPVLVFLMIVCIAAFFKRSGQYLVNYNTQVWFSGIAKRRYLKSERIRKSEEDMVKYAVMLDNLKIELAELDKNIESLEKKRKSFNIEENLWEG